MQPQELSQLPCWGCDTGAGWMGCLYNPCCGERFSPRGFECMMSTSAAVLCSMGMGAGYSRTSTQSRTMAFRSWSPSGIEQGWISQHQSASSTPTIPQSSVTVVREREDSWPVGAPDPVPAADEKIRLAQVALQEAMDEKNHDIREHPLAEARLELFQKEIATSRPATPGPALAAPISKPRFQGCMPSCEMQVGQTPIRPPQSSDLSADLLRERGIPNVEQDSPRRFLQTGP